MMGMAAVAAAAPSIQTMVAATATRAVADYSGLEQRLESLLEIGGRVELENLLGDDFTYATPDTGDPLDRAQYLDAEMSRRAVAARVYALGVIERGDFDLVSCLVRVHFQVGARRVFETRYVVDLWQRADHRLLSRYQSMPRSPPPPPSHPSGRG